MFTSILAIAAGTFIGSAVAQSASGSAAPATTSKAAAAAPPATTAAAPATTAAAAANPADTILVDKQYTWPNIPYQVDTVPTGRGPQSGYNICNSTTVGPTSNCQTAWINSPSDFCLWGSAQPNSIIGNDEAASIAWCTDGSHGTRVMPAGTITALQWLDAPGYIQVTGLINQGNIDEDPTDSGGELDPHGADGRGNPLGGLVFTSAFGSSIQQVVEWNSFMGSGIFCFKACKSTSTAAPFYCNNIYDELGCSYNAPAAYEPGVFESCLSDNQDPVGIYTGSDGIVSTYHQTDPLGTLPYQPKVPASSSCTTLTSASLFTGAAAAVSTTISGSVAAATTGAAAATTKAATTGSASTAKATSANAGDAQFEVTKLGGIAVVAIGAMVGALMVL